MTKEAGRKKKNAGRVSEGKKRKRQQIRPILVRVASHKTASAQTPDGTGKKKKRGTL